MTALGPLVADGWGMHGDIGAGWWIVMMLGMVVFWGGIILFIVWLVRGGFDRSRTPVVSAMEILERRFAEGAITVDEYRERRETLANGAAPTSGGEAKVPPAS